VKEIRQLQRLIESYGEKAVVITTEKDGVKLTSRKHIPKELQERLYVLPIELNFRDGDEKQFVSKVISELKNKQ
jgi:tetraacyldisaccharide-1-P 4'-kinase